MVDLSMKRKNNDTPKTNEAIRGVGWAGGTSQVAESEPKVDLSMRTEII